MKMLLRCVLVLLICGMGATSWAAQVSFAALARHPQYKMVKISPDGTHIAVTSVTAAGRTVLSLLDLATHKGVNIIPRGGDDVLDFWWVSPKRVVYDEAEPWGGLDKPIPTGELYSVKADSGAPVLLYGYRAGGTAEASRIRRATPELGSATFLSRIDGDPNHILIVVAPWLAKGSLGVLTEVYKIDVRTGRKERVAGAPVREARFVADHHGHVRFAYALGLHGKAKVYMRSAGGDWTLLPQASKDREEPIAFSANDKLVWFTCPGQSTGFGVCTFDPTTRKMRHVWSNPHVQARTLAQGLARGSVIGVRFSDGRPAISVFNNQMPGVKALVELMKQYPGEDVRFVSGTADGSKAIALVEADVDPGTFFLYDRAGNKFTPLLQRTPWINPNQLGRVDPFTFKTRDGLTEHGYITYPPGKQGAKNLPLVVFVHGGPFGIRDWWEYDPYVQALATRGYAVLQVNYRGSGGYGYDFVKAGWKQWGGKMQDDVTDATRWAIKQGIANPNRICIYGGSYGGYAALEGAVKVPDLYKCAIGYVGVYNLRMMYTRGDIPQNLYGKDFLKRTLGTDKLALERHSPIYQLNRLKAKVMLIVGGRDQRVPPVQGEDMREAMRKRGLHPVWLYKRGEGHGFYNQKNLAELMAKVDAFVAANIGPGVGSVKTASATH